MEADLAAMLRRCRAAAQLTQEDLAARSGVTVHAISALERGIRRHPQQKTLSLLAAALRLDDAQFGLLTAAASRNAKPAEDGPRELPADVSLLVGRDDVLLDAEGFLTDRARRHNAATVLCLHGAAGMGKSAAAVRIGHTVASTYPDGQLFARLLDADGERVPPGVILGRLLRSLGIPNDRIPDAADERSALFGSRLADRAVLVVLDDAVDVAQIRPLLPAGPRCAAIVTSRPPLLGLEDAKHRELTGLSDRMSRHLLVELARGSVAPSSETSLAAIVRHCVGLPLALRIVGLQLALSRGSDVERVASALADDAQRLDSLIAGDLAVRTSLDVALATADGEARALFERLALIGVDEFSPWVAAPLLDCDEETGERAVERLAQLGMVQLRRLAPNPRYGMHGVLRAFAIERLMRCRPDDRAESELRYLRVLLKLSTIADEARGVVLQAADGLPHHGGQDLPKAEVVASAAGWFDTEAAGVVAAIDSALGADRPDLAAELALRINSHLHRRDDREVKVGTLTKVRDALAGTDRPDLTARVDLAMCTAIAIGEWPGSDLATAAERALAAASEMHWPSFEVSALNFIGHAAHRSCDFDRALRANEQALQIIEAHPELDSKRAATLGNIGSVLRDCGEHSRALTMIRSACKAHTGHIGILAVMLTNLADVLADLDAVDELSDVVVELQRLVAELRDPLGHAHVTVRAARLAIRRGDLGGAQSLLETAELAFAEHLDPHGASAMLLARAEAALVGGDVARARQLLAAGIEKADNDGYVLGAHRFRLLLRSAKYLPPASR